jgi:hypothetical protein
LAFESTLLSDEVATVKLEKQRRAAQRLVSEMGMDPAKAEAIAKDPSLAEAMLSVRRTFDETLAPEQDR